MQADFLDRHSRLDSPVHRLPAGAKLAAALALVVAAVALPRSQAIWLAALAGPLLAAAAISRVPWGFLARRMLLLEPFVIGVAVLALFAPGGGWAFAFLVARASVCLFAMLLLANTTPFGDLLRVLGRLHVPALLVTTLALMYRYLFVLVDEAQRMKRARTSRTFRPGRSRTWRTSATVIGQLFIRASERAERIYAAMCARGWR
ncbi:MAG: cobalt ECF transporter T component CbiQ [Planctomycetota bacterium]|nr:cobalt ECF transporter T component CbiQ [Planctomycetota bacterium]